MTALTTRPFYSLGLLAMVGALAFGCSSSDDDESPPCRDCVYPATGGTGAPPSGPVGAGLPSAGGTTQVAGGAGGSAPATTGGSGGTVGGAFGGTGGDMSNPISVGGALGVGGDTSVGGTVAAGGTIGADPGTPFGTGGTSGF